MNPAIGDIGRSLSRLQVRADTVLVSQGDTVLATRRDGYLEGDAENGLFVHETRMLSRYRCRIGRRTPFPVAMSSIRQDQWLGYYITSATGSLRESAQQALEMQVLRVVGEGMHEDIDLANHTQAPMRFRLTFEIDGDFADLEETHGPRKQRGKLLRHWSPGPDASELVLDYRHKHLYRHQGHRGTAHTHRTLTLRIDCADAQPRHRGRRLWFDIELQPHERWHACFTWCASIDGRTLAPPACRRFAHAEAPERPEQRYIDEATRIETAESPSLAPVVVEAFARAREDLAALRLHRLDRGPDAWTVTAGLPMFLALFGRDSLTVAYQSALLGPEIMRGTLPALADVQGRKVDDWRDEQPGRILHEAHTGPLGRLCFDPKARDYFSLTASGLFPFVVAQLWQWTADREAVGPMIEPALRALHWLDTEAVDERGFHAIATRSRQGIDNQTWKDSGDSLVYEDGSKVSQPVASCEEQGIAYAAKVAFAEVLRCFDRDDEARKLLERARELRKRFNDAYWLEDARCFAMCLDPGGRAVASVGSNSLHCVATGIADEALAPRVMARLFEPDLFSGWGIRTLSSDHPAYNPYAYHRGTVWPVEHGPFAIGGYRYGCHPEVERIAQAMFEATALFEHRRLPECFAGHARDDAHPFPALYPAANVPQAWSASTVPTMVQAMLGIYPHAASGILLVDPHLPSWLPEVVLRNLRVGEACCDLRFTRVGDGGSRHEVLAVKGKLDVRLQPSPWSLGTGRGIEQS